MTCGQPPLTLASTALPGSIVHDHELDQAVLRFDRECDLRPWFGSGLRPEFLVHAPSDSRNRRRTSGLARRPRCSSQSYSRPGAARATRVIRFEPTTNGRAARAGASTATPVVRSRTWATGTHTHADRHGRAPGQEKEIIRRGHQSALEAFERGFTENETRLIGSPMLSASLRFGMPATDARPGPPVRARIASPKDRRETWRPTNALGTMLRDEIERGSNGGDFHVDDIPATATAIFSLCLDVARWYSPRSRPRPEEIGELYGQLALRMID